jgi:hypothetical protein|tara:strand:- start:1180 stop:1362 length:183 start_codon:yes stop_codon:yes gene_type:complete
MPKWRVLVGPIRHNGVDYAEGSVIEAEADRVANLIDGGRIKKSGRIKKMGTRKRTGEDTE